MHALQDEQHTLTLIRQHDNSVVTVATNITEEAVLGVGNDRHEKKYKIIPQPTVIQEYNQHMDSVDHFCKLCEAHKTDDQKQGIVLA